jgi:hypothetical protein
MVNTSLLGVTLSYTRRTPVFTLSLVLLASYAQISDPSPLLAAVAMSNTTPTASSSSSNLQAVFEASLKEYEKKTKKSLLTHPLMAQFQACKSPADILAVLRSHASKFGETMSADDRLIKWLEPIVNVLSASSSVISAGVGMVSPTDDPSTFQYLISYL